MNYRHVTVEETDLFDQKTNSQGKLTFLHDDKVSKRAMFAHEVEDCATLQSKCLNILRTTVTLFDSWASDCDADGSENKVDIIAPTTADIDAPTATTTACTATTAAIDTTFITSSPTKDVTTDIEKATDKILISVIADDEPTFIGEDIQDFPSKISNARIDGDDLANVINIVPKAVKISSVSTSTIKIIADDNPVFMAQTANMSPVNSIAIFMLADDAKATVTTAVESPNNTGILAAKKGEPHKCKFQGPMQGMIFLN